MEWPTPINWTSTFPLDGLLDGIFHFDSNFNKISCKQAVETFASDAAFCSV